MNRNCIVLLSIFLIFSISGGTWAGEKAPQSIYDLAKNQLAPHGSDAVIVKGVIQKNNEGETLDQIKALDEKWRNTPGIADFMEALMTNDIARHLTTLMNQEPYFAEIFVMDKNGANVAMTGKTSDYWQGDEDKFIKAFNDGQGAVFVDEVEFDDSTQSYLVQVSVPVMNEGKAIGTITIGIDMDAFE